MAYPLTGRQFYEGLKQGRLLGLKCEECGAHTAPPKMACAECGSVSVTVTGLSGRGVLRTFTVVRVAPEGFQAPYIVAVSELAEGPWLMGNLEGVAADQADESLMGRQVRVGYRILPPLDYAAGEVVTITFSLE